MQHSSCLVTLEQNIRDFLGFNGCVVEDYLPVGYDVAKLLVNHFRRFESKQCLSDV